MLFKISGHGPYSNEINVHRGTERPLKSGGKLEPSFVSALVEGIGEGDLFIVVSRQQPYLISRGIKESHEIKS